MCSPRPSPTPPPTMTIAERNAQLNALTLRIASETASGNMKAASIDTGMAHRLEATPVDPASAIFAKVGPQAQQTVAPSADNLELAPEKLIGLLQKRATSTLRIPATLPKSTQ